MKRIHNAGLIVGLGFCLFAAPVVAQDEPGPVAVEVIEEPADDWFSTIMVGDVLLSAVAMAVTQVIKILLSRWLPDGTGGLVALVVSIILVAIALAAGYMGVEQEVGETLLRVETGAKALIVFLGALGWYEVQKRAELFPPIIRG